MKVIQICPLYRAGSVGKIAYDISVFLTENNIENSIIAGYGEKNKLKKGDYLSSNKFLKRINQFLYFVTGYNLRFNLISTNKIIEILKKENPDIVHIHTFNEYYLNVKKLFKYLGKKKVKTLITLHCEHYYTGSCGYSVECNQWKDGGCTGHCPHYKDFLIFPLFDKSKAMWKRMNKSYQFFENENLFFASCTPWLSKRLAQSTILSKFSNNFVVFNGAEESIFKGHTDIIKKNILYVCPRFDDPVKNAQGINKLAEVLPDDIEINVVGNVPHTFKFNKKINFKGPLFLESLAKEYSNSGVSVMLSQRECFPMVVVESILCGTKVVAFKCFGPDECYPPQYVKFVKFGDYKSMADEIARILKSGYNKNDVSNFAREYYTKKKMSENYLSLYKKMLNIDN